MWQSIISVLKWKNAKFTLTKSKTLQNAACAVQQAVISPVGKIVDHGKEICMPSGMEKMGPITQKLYDTLTGIQMGHIEAPKGWIQVID